MRLFHGTTADKLPSILKNGLTVESGCENWTVSGEAVYFWSVKYLEKFTAEDYGSNEDFIYRAKQLAFESAQFGLGFSKDCRAVVIEVDLKQTEIEIDNSCEFMSKTGAVCTRKDVSPAKIKSIKISPDLSLLKGYFLALCLGRNICARYLNPTERTIAEAMKAVDLTDAIEEICGNVEEWEDFLLTAENK